LSSFLNNNFRSIALISHSLSTHAKLLRVLITNP